jgi:hypothetical protein
MGTGCAPKKTVMPQFSERHCPYANSIRTIVTIKTKDGIDHPVAVCRDLKKPEALFPESLGCNPYRDIDCDGDEDEAKPQKHEWWKFWRTRDEKDTD